MRNRFKNKTTPGCRCFVTALILTLTASPAAAQVTSALWGVDGEAWDPNGLLKDFSGAGYKNGNEPIPDWPVGVNVTNFGAVADDDIDDSQAFLDAIAACPPYHAVFVPNGTYNIEQQIVVTDKDNFVLRGEDMYETVLWMPYYLTEIPNADGRSAFFHFRYTTQSSIENFSIIFRDQPKGGHWEFLGNDAVRHQGVTHSWIRNLYIKNADHAIMIGAPSSGNNTIQNIILDQYIERVGMQGSSSVGHMGIAFMDSGPNLVDNVKITANWIHDLNQQGGRKCVWSRISGPSLRLDHHAQGVRDNLWTDIDFGVGEAWFGGESETYWNVRGDVNRSYSDPSERNIFVGCQSADPTDLGTDYWHESIPPESLVPSNIYFAQLEKAGKPIPVATDLTLPPDEEWPRRLLAVDDAQVQGGDKSNENFGAKNRIWVNGGTGNRDLKGYFKYDLSGLGVTHVAHAKLRMYRQHGSGDGATINEVSDDSWSERSITHANQPAFGPVAGTATDVHGGWAEVDLTSYVNRELAGDQIVSFRLQGNLTVMSAEGGKPAQLVLYQDASKAEPPAAPTGLVATPGDGLVSLDWNDNTDSDIAHYNLYRKTGDSSGYGQIILNRKNSDSGGLKAGGLIYSHYQDIKVSNGTTYSYMVKAVDSSGIESASGDEVHVMPLDPTNQPPAFTSDPIVEMNAGAGNAYSATLADDASDPESDPMTFELLSGPAWLSVASDGGLSGTPDLGDIGTNTFDVEVTAIGLSDTNTLQITVIVDTVPPTVPTGLAATPGDRLVSLDWDDNTESDLDSYSVYRSTTSGTYGTALATHLTASDYIDRTAANDTTYYYVVTATDGNGNESAESGEVAATPLASLNQAPAFASDPVSKPFATVGDFFRQTLAVDADDYESDPLHFSLVSPPTWLRVASDGSLSGTPGDQHVGTNTFTVQVSGTGGSDTAELVIDVVENPFFLESGGMVSMEAENGLLGSRWTTGTNSATGTEPSGGAYLVVDPSYDHSNNSPRSEAPEALASYRFQISTAGDYRFWFRILSTSGGSDSFFWRVDGGSWVRENGRQGPAWFSSGVGGLGEGSHVLDIAYRESTQLDKFVVQLDGGASPSGNGPPESNRDVLEAAAPAAPTGLTATAVATNSIQLSWTDNSDNEAGFELQRSDDDGSSWMHVATTAADATGYTDDGLRTNTRYTYRVLAVNSGGSSAASSEATVTLGTLTPAPTGLAATPGDGQVGLDWDDSSDSNVTYSVYRSTTSGSYGGTLASGLSASSHVDSTAVNGTTYYYAVTASNSEGESLKSGEVIAIPTDPSNQPPAFLSDPIIETNATERVAYVSSISDSAADPESDAMTFSLLSGPAWLSVAPDGGLSGTPGTGDVGTNSFTVQVIAAGGSDTATLRITVDPTTPPEAYAGADQTVAIVNTPMPGLWFGSVSGEMNTTTPNPKTELLVNVASKTEDGIAGNTTEVFTGRIYDADGQISFTEDIDDNTRIWIDGVLVLQSDTWNDRVSSGNLNLAGGWHDIEIRIGNAAGGSGPYSSPGIGFDPAGGTAWQTLVDPGDGSLLQGGNATLVTAELLDATATDADGDPLTLAWSLLDGPVPVTFADPGAVNTTATFTIAGTYVLRLTADDGLAQSFDDVTITVTASSQDTDNDGIDDAWETEHFPGQEDVIDGAADSDGDGIKDYFEYLYGADPNDAGSRGQGLRVATVSGTPRIQWTMREGMQPGSQFRIEYTTDLSDPDGWRELPSTDYTLTPNTSGGMTTMELEITADHGDQVFLRLRSPD